MVKTKTLAPEGEILHLETEKIQKSPLVISQTQAKKLMKKEMTEKQSAHVQKLVEANKLRFEQKKKEKEDLQKQEISRLVEEKLKQQQEGKVQQVIVAPKRIYKPKKKIIVEETESESEESVEIVKVKKTKPIPKEHIEEKIETIKKIDNILKSSTNPYSHLVRF